MANYLWLFVVAGGATLLGVAIGFAVARQRRLRPTEKRAQDEKVKELYGKK
jgi:hypothetical protein